MVHAKSKLDRSNYKQKIFKKSLSNEKRGNQRLGQFIIYNRLLSDMLETTSEKGRNVGTPRLDGAY